MLHFTISAISDNLIFILVKSRIIIVFLHFIINFMCKSNTPADKVHQTKGVFLSCFNFSNKLSKLVVTSCIVFHCMALMWNKITFFVHNNLFHSFTVYLLLHLWPLKYSLSTMLDVHPAWIQSSTLAWLLYTWLEFSLVKLMPSFFSSFNRKWQD